MIRNEKFYRLTKTEADKFADVIARMEAGESPNPQISPRLRQASIDGMKSILEELREDMAEYDELKAGKVRHFEAHSLGELPEMLIKARIASGMTQKQLAEKAGLKEQQIQRYESSDYESASLTRLLKIAGAIGVQCESLTMELAA